MARKADYAYIVMPRIKGQTFVRVIEEIAKTADENGTDHVEIDWTLLADIGCQVASALEICARAWTRPSRYQAWQFDGGS